MYNGYSIKTTDKHMTAQDRQEIIKFFQETEGRTPDEVEIRTAWELCKALFKKE